MTRSPPLLPTMRKKLQQPMLQFVTAAASVSLPMLKRMAIRDTRDMREHQPLKAPDGAAKHVSASRNKPHARIRRTSLPAAMLEAIYAFRVHIHAAA